jgi:hypothetical protein
MAIDLEQKSPLARLSPTKHLGDAMWILLLSILWGLVMPGVVAHFSRIFYDRDAKKKMASILSLRPQFDKLAAFETQRRALEDSVAALDKKLANFANDSPDPDQIKATVELQQRLKTRLASLSPPITVASFYFSSTMLLWPVIFTCLGWVAFLIPPEIRLSSTRIREIVLITLAISLVYRWPTLARNFAFRTEGRLFYGIANWDTDPAGFVAQELLSLTVSLLLAVIWSKWITLFSERLTEIPKSIEAPVSAALDWSSLADLSRSFIHWQISSVVVACGFIPYLYFFWDAVLRGHDQRYLIGAITVQVLWAVTWGIISLPLAATFYSWQSIRSAAICAIGRSAFEDDEKAKSALEAIKSLEPINPWNLAVTSVAFFVSFVGPFIQQIKV